jgi:hypothetical protein
MTPVDNLHVRLTPGSADRQHPAAKVRWPTGEPPAASEPAELAATLRDLGRLDPVELGQQAVLEQVVQAAATCCDSSGGVGLLLLDRDQQLRYVAAAGGPDALWRVRRCDLAKARRWTHFCWMHRLRAGILPVSHAGPSSAPWQ